MKSPQLPQLIIEMLGGLRVSSANQDRIDIPPGQASHLLAYLALHKGRCHNREELADLFWPESEMERARQNLRQYIRSLRLVLSKSLATDSVLEITRTTAGLNAQSVWTDVDQYERSVRATNKSADACERIALLSQAAELYKGGLLPGFYHTAIVEERERLAEVHRGVLQKLALDLQTTGEVERALRYAREAVQLDPLDESAHCALMSLYAASGQPSAVQRQYRELERILREDLNAEPLESIRQLAAALSQTAEQNVDPRRFILPSETPDIAPQFAPASQRTSHPESEPARTNYPDHKRTNRFLPVISGGVGLLALGIVWSFGSGVKRARTPQIAIQRPDLAAPKPHHMPLQIPVPDARPASVASIVPPARPTFTVPLARPNGSSKQRQDALALTHPETAPPAMSPGGMEWAAHHVLRTTDRTSEPKSMTADAAGNIYVTGFVDTNTKNDTDYVTLKYRSDGKLLWERRHNGPGSDLDRAYSVAVDAGGNVYVTGESDGGKGTSPERLHGTDIATIKYDPDGRELWVQRYAGPADGRDVGWKLALDGMGNCYVFGQSWGGNPALGGNRVDGVCIKYDTAGAEEWVRRITDVRTGLDLNGSMWVDRAGNVYLAYCAAASDQTQVFETRKYNTVGNLKWSKRQSDRLSVPTCLAVDASGNVYVSGGAWGADDKDDISSRYHFLTVKYDSNGATIWTRRHDGGDYANRAVALAVDPRGGVYVTGDQRGNHYETVKYDSDGAEKWAEGYHGTGTSPCHPYGIAIDSKDRIYVAGRTTYMETPNPGKPAVNVSEYAAVAYSSTGHQESVLRCGYPYPSFPYGWAALIVVDREDNVIVAGQASIPPCIVTVKYRSLPR